MTKFKHVAKFIGAILGIILGISLLVWLGISLFKIPDIAQNFIITLIVLLSLGLPGVFVIFLINDYQRNPLTRLQTTGIIVGSYVISLIAGMIIKYWWYGGQDTVKADAVSSWVLPIIDASIYSILGTVLIFVVLLVVAIVIILVYVLAEALWALWDKLG